MNSIARNIWPQVQTNLTESRSDQRGLAAFNRSTNPADASSQCAPTCVAIESVAVRNCTWNSTTTPPYMQIVRIHRIANSTAKVAWKWSILLTVGWGDFGSIFLQSLFVQWSLHNKKCWPNFPRTYGTKHSWAAFAQRFLKSRERVQCSMKIRSIAIRPRKAESRRRLRHCSILEQVGKEEDFELRTAVKYRTTGTSISERPAK